VYVLDIIQEHGAATMAQMALRVRSNSDAIMEAHGHTSIAQAMRLHPTAVALQRQCCLVIRYYYKAVYYSCIFHALIICT
jgi:hypothetical protein